MYQTQYTKSSKGQSTNAPNPLMCAIVACTGDSRCITNDGHDGSSFRSVTVDHRPGNAEEMRRLKKYVAQGVVLVERDDPPAGALRLYPGGLAVSRTIGDLALSEAAVTQPDVFTVGLKLENGGNYRFIIASDGLWDVFDTDAVGVLAARVKQVEDGTEKVTSAKEAAKEILDACIKEGGYEDDVTVLVMDISLR